MLGQNLGGWMRHCKAIGNMVISVFGSTAGSRHLSLPYFTHPRHRYLFRSRFIARVCMEWKNPGATMVDMVLLNARWLLIGACTLSLVVWC